LDSLPPELPKELIVMTRYERSCGYFALVGLRKTNQLKE